MPPPFMPPPGMPMPPGLPRFPALPPGFRLPPPGFIPKTIGDWTEHRLPDGRLYYHNNKSKESKWEKPLEFTESAESNFFFYCHVWRLWSFYIGQYSSYEACFVAKCM